MKLGYSETDGSVFIFFESHEIKEAHELFIIVKELEEKDGKLVPLLGDIICKDKSYGMFCFEFAFKDREFITRFLEVMVEVCKIEGQVEEMNKLENTLKYINFFQCDELPN